MMDKKETTKCGCQASVKEVNEYPGVAVDQADDCKVSKEAVDAYTRELNDNPRSDE